MPPDATGIVVTCEHAGNLVPARYKNLFRNQENRLNSHRGYDIGALSLAQTVSSALDAPLFHTKTTRLLIEANRSLHSRNLFSPITRPLARDMKTDIIRTVYRPYRRQVEECLQQIAAAGRMIIHLSIHTFTPVLDGRVRKTDIGVLYDPKRSGEKQVSRQLVKTFQQDNSSALICRCNYPYKGISDSLTTSLRKQYPEDQYVGLEIEVNQKHCLAGSHAWKIVCRQVADVLKTVFRAR